MTLPWQVVSTWVVPEGGTESVQIAAFATYEEAYREAQRLCPMLGKVGENRLLRGLHIAGEFKTLKKKGK